MRFGQRLFLGAEEARVGDLLPVAKRGKRLQPHVNADLLPGCWQRRWFGALTGEADVPLAGAAAADGGRLGRAFQRAMQDDLHQPDAMQPQPAGLSIQLAADRHLRIGDAVVAPWPRKRG